MKLKPGIVNTASQDIELNWSQSSSIELGNRTPNFLWSRFSNQSNLIEQIEPDQAQSIGVAFDCVCIGWMNSLQWTKIMLWLMCSKKHKNTTCSTDVARASRTCRWFWPVLQKLSIESIVQLFLWEFDFVRLPKLIEFKSSSLRLGSMDYAGNESKLLDIINWNPLCSVLQKNQTFLI